MMKKILYVEDDTITRFLVRKSLELNGFNVEEAGDGNEAFSIIDENTEIEYVLLDLNMPGMNGFDFLKRVAATPQLNYLKVIVTSAIPKEHFKTQATKEDIGQTQIIGYLEKPMLFPDLMKILSTN